MLEKEVAIFFFLSPKFTVPWTVTKAPSGAVYLGETHSIHFKMDPEYNFFFFRERGIT